MPRRGRSLKTPRPVKQASHRTDAVGPAHGRDPQGQRGAGGRPLLGRGLGRSP